MKHNQELFFNHIKQIFLENPYLSIDYDTIYSELMIFNAKRNNLHRLDRKNMVSVQTAMANRYRYDNRVNTYLYNDYFWVIENRKRLNDKEYYEEIGNSIKLYIAVDPSIINNVASMIFDYIISENILSQSKISKQFRNDALVVRVRNKEDAEKIVNFVNGINYTSAVKPNPFIHSIGNVSMTLDGTLSYNLTFTTLLSRYLHGKYEQQELDNASLSEFKTWLIKEIEILKSSYNEKKLNEYEIKDNEQLKDFIMVMEILSKNLEGNIEKEDIYKQQEKRLSNGKEEITKYSNNDFNYILHIMNGLVNKYGIEEAHEIIMYYINKRVGVDIFTRDKNIRNIVIDNFSPENMKKVLLSMGDNALINAINETINKYDIEQARYAIRRLIEEKTIESFTNDNDARSYLGFIIPRELLQELIVDKVIAQKLYPSVDNMIHILLEEAQNINKSKGRN